MIRQIRRGQEEDVSDSRDSACWLVGQAHFWGSFSKAGGALFQESLHPFLVIAAEIDASP